MLLKLSHPPFFLLIGALTLFISACAGSDIPTTTLTTVPVLSPTLNSGILVPLTATVNVLPGPDSTVVTSLSAMEIIKQSLTTMNTLSGYKVNSTYFDIEKIDLSGNGILTFEEVSTLSEANIDPRSRSDSASITTTIRSVDYLNEKIDAGGKCYTRSSVTQGLPYGPWSQVEQAKCSSFRLPHDSLSTLKNGKILGQTTIDGQPVYHLQAEYDQTKDLRKDVSYAAPIDFFIGINNFYLFEFKGSPTFTSSTGQRKVDSHYKFREFNSTFKIDVPVVQ